MKESYDTFKDKLKDVLSSERRCYEEERFMLRCQEVIAGAIKDSGIDHKEIEKNLNATSGYVSDVLSDKTDYDIMDLPKLAWAVGIRLNVTGSKLNAEKKEISDEVRKYINDTPEFSSFLYDVDFLPEQIKSETGAWAVEAMYFLYKGLKEAK